MLYRVANAPLNFQHSGPRRIAIANLSTRRNWRMRAVFRSVVVVVGISASVVSGSSGVSLTASHQADSLAVASVRPSTGQVVGIAYPVVVTFRAPVVNRRAAERAVDVR